LSELFLPLVGISVVASIAFSVLLLLRFLKVCNEGKAEKIKFSPNRERSSFHRWNFYFFSISCARH
jgi:hypothetical protein